MRNALPAFKQPTPPTPDPGLAAAVTQDPPPASPTPAPPAHRGDSPASSGDALYGQPTRRPDHEPARTVISSASKPSSKDTADLIVGLIAVAAIGAAAIVRWRMGRKLRQPNKTQSRDIAAPLADIALRHFDASWLNKDLADALAAMAATGAYLNDGPLLGPLRPAEPLPDDLQETDE